MSYLKKDVVGEPLSLLIRSLLTAADSLVPVVRTQ